MIKRKKLIEVALPLEAINIESLRRKQKAPKGWPTSFHKWWAQRPLAAARAVIFAQMVDDPSSLPDLFPTEVEQERERQRLFRLIEELVLWDNTNDKSLSIKVRAEIQKSWDRLCDENSSHPDAERLYNKNKLPPFWDPFAGSGSIPLSGQWLGLESFATDLNPVAVLINKAILEIPYKFFNFKPINPDSRKNVGMIDSQWIGTRGLADDVRYYSALIKTQADKDLIEIYPKIKITNDIVKKQPELKRVEGQELIVTAWLWARTVKSPNPAFSSIDVPLASTFILSSKTGKEVYVEPIIQGAGYEFVVRQGKSPNPESTKNGTKAARGANFNCILSNSPIPSDYVKQEAKSGRMGSKLMAIVAQSGNGRVFISPTIDQEQAAASVRNEWRPDLTISGSSQYLGIKPYGMDNFDQLFSERQLYGITYFSDAIQKIQKIVMSDAAASGLIDDGKKLHEGGMGVTAYADAIACYLACVVDRMAYYGSTLTTWLPKDNALRDCMPRQALAMTWDYAEGNPIGKSSIDVITCSKSVANYLDIATAFYSGTALQSDAQTGHESIVNPVVSTDPPYYDNVPYADLSDFFYIWLRRSLKNVYPNIFSTVAVPKEVARLI